MSDLMKKAKSSKLYDIKQKQEKITKKINKYDMPKSFRFDDITIDILKNTVEKIKEINPKLANETSLLKGLIFLSKNINTKKLIKAIKESIN